MAGRLTTLLPMVLQHVPSQCYTSSVQNLAESVCRMTQSIQDMPPPEFGKAADDTAELELGDNSSISSGDTQVLTAACLNTSSFAAIALHCTSVYDVHTPAG